MAAFTRDTFFNGCLVVHQMRSGYRFSIDAVLLAATVHPKPGEALLDLGTGCGIIPLILAHRHPDLRIHAIELQKSLADLARLNIAANRMEQQIALTRADMRDVAPATVGAPFDWVVSNPPFRTPCSGRINPDDQKALARHEIKVNLAQMVATARRMLRTGGRFATVFPSTRAMDLLEQMRSAGIEPKWLQGVHSRAEEPAKLLLVHGTMAGRPGLSWDRPLVVYGADGNYTPAVREMMNAPA